MWILYGQAKTNHDAENKSSTLESKLASQNHAPCSSNAPRAESQSRHHICCETCYMLSADAGSMDEASIQIRLRRYLENEKVRKEGLGRPGCLE